MRKRAVKSPTKHQGAKVQPSAKPQVKSKATIASPRKGKPSASVRTTTRDRTTVAVRPTQLRPTKAGEPIKAEARVVSKTSLCIVGIGASAGGLEALEQFLAQVPENSGMVWVIIQHLDPTHEGALVELLQRASNIPVLQAKNNLLVEANHVYVIPPNRDMSVREDRLKLVPQPMPRGLNLPIDCFFRSLASDKQDRSIGVILSGMGSDGTLGLREIKANAGAAFVQAPDMAKFDGMPRSAIDAGLADVIAAADELPAKILDYARQAPQVARLQLLEGQAQNSLDKIYALLRSHTGNDFTLYKKSTIHRRIERRMGLHQIDGIASYVRFLRENPREIELLFKELLIGVTSFFRDASAWAELASQAIPALLAKRAAGGVVRAWVPGCSTGEEAYSLAIAFKEALEHASTLQHVSLQIFATDLDRDAIERARHGVYAESIAADVSPARLRRYFTTEEHGYRITKEIRDMVVFAPQNIVMDPPFTKVDILICRNLLIYLSAELQKKIIPLFHYSLNPSGILFLGSAETIGSFSNLFDTVDNKSRLYRKLEPLLGASSVEVPAAAYFSKAGEMALLQSDGTRPSKAVPSNLQALADRVLVQRFSPVAVLCTDKGDVLYTSGRTGKYLEPSVGKANMNIHAMAREGLRYELSGAFSKAVREDRVVTVRNLKIGGNGEVQHVDLTVQKLSEPHELRGSVMIVIADVSGPPQAVQRPRSRRPESARVAELEEELKHYREELQSSEEELKSANEELQSTNEELQSSNEELTTSKEEMQSLNEELQTVNHELQAKVDELSRSNNDMKNLLNSTDIATLFLDSELRVRRFTTPTAKIIKLIAGDAGRPITDIASNLNYSELTDDAREVLRTLASSEKHVASNDGHWFSVRIMPYRTQQNVIDGVVLTFTDVSASRMLEEALREQANQLRQMAESLPSLIWSCRANGSCDFLNHRWIEYTGIPATEQLGYGWLAQVHPAETDAVLNGWQSAVAAGTPFEVEFRLRETGGSYRWHKTRLVPIRDASGEIQKWYGTTTDVDELKRTVETLSRLQEVLEATGEGFLALDADAIVTYFNSAAVELLGVSRLDLTGKRLWEVFPGVQGSEFERKIKEVLRNRGSATFDMTFRPHPDSDKQTFMARICRQRFPEWISIFLTRYDHEATA